MSMQFTVSPENQDLHITADAEVRADLQDAYTRGGYRQAQGVFFEYAEASGYSFVAPEWICALTDAPILTEADEYTLTDDGEHIVDGEVWWFPSYAVRDELQELIDTGEVT